MLIWVGLKLIRVEEFEGSLALMFHIRERAWNMGEIDGARNAALSRLGNMLYAAGLTGD